MRDPNEEKGFLRERGKFCKKNERNQKRNEGERASQKKIKALPEFRPKLLENSEVSPI